MRGARSGPFHMDMDSEGLLLLTDNGSLQARIANPKHRLPKTYPVQIEGNPDPASLAELRRGVRLKDGWTCRPRSSGFLLRICGRGIRRSASAKTSRIAG